MAAVYFVLSDRFRVDELLSKISLLPREDRWQTLARMALRYDLYAALAALTAEVLGHPSDTGRRRSGCPSGSSQRRSIAAAHGRWASSTSRARPGPAVGAAAPDPHPGAAAEGWRGCVIGWVGDAAIFPRFGSVTSP